MGCDEVGVIVGKDVAGVIVGRDIVGTKVGNQVGKGVVNNEVDCEIEGNDIVGGDDGNAVEMRGFAIDFDREIVSTSSSEIQYTNKQVRPIADKSIIMTEQTNIRFARDGGGLASKE